MLKKLFQIKIILPAIILILSFAQWSYNYCTSLNRRINDIEIHSYQEMQLLLDKTQSHMEHDLDSGNFSLIDQTVVGFGSLEKYTNSYFVDDEDIILCSMRRSEISMPLKSVVNKKHNSSLFELLPAIKKCRTSLHTKILYDENKFQVIGVAPILYHSTDSKLRADKVGLFILSHNMDKEKKYAKQILFTQFMQTGIFVFILVVVVVYLLYTCLITKIYKLIKATDQFAEGNYDVRCNLTGENEITALGNAFNNMAIKVENANSALLESEKRFKDFFNLSADLVCIAEINGFFQMLNPSWEKVLGYSISELKSKPFIEYVHPDDVNKTLDIIEKKLKIGETVLSFENRYICKNGKTVWLEWTSQPSVETGKTFAIARNITERKKLEEQIRQNDKMQAIGKLAGGIAHEFNNQMTGILGYSDMLCNKLKEEDCKKYANKIIQATRNCSELTKRLLAFSQQGKYKIVIIDVHLLIAEVIGLVCRSINKNIKIKQLLVADEYIVNADYDQIQNAILNVVINASESMPNGGVLTISTNVKELNSGISTKLSESLKPGKYLQINISDTGVGMDEDIQKRCFEPFFSTKHMASGKGVGMGLSSAYGTIINHGGLMDVKSEVGAGSTFKIYLPLVKTATFEPLKDSNSKNNISSKNILIIDDEIYILDVVNEMLSSLGCTVTTFQNPQKAIEFYKRSQDDISLVILDMIMPNMDGKECFSELKKINSEVKVLIFSGYDLTEDIKALIDQGALDFIQKPFNTEDISEVLNKILK